ncbi:hypothetical protein OG592_27220 [Streptomyces avidinii]|uniref:hypothetical protein n=1 Tax=Streptomyces avidinii TaxID=1895 RepID=UPI00386BEE3C|nr:hypothetical protein OG592_27220 [Streptomyces avidinii]
MTPARRQEIRRLAHQEAASELSAITNHWETPARLFVDPEERDEFEAAVNAICRRLARQAQP